MKKFKIVRVDVNEDISEKEEKTMKSGTKKGLIIGGIIAILAGIAVAIKAIFGNNQDDEIVDDYYDEDSDLNDDAPVESVDEQR